MEEKNILVVKYVDEQTTCEKLDVRKHVKQQLMEEKLFAEKWQCQIVDLERGFQLILAAQTTTEDSKPIRNITLEQIDYTST